MALSFTAGAAVIAVITTAFFGIAAIGDRIVMAQVAPITPTASTGSAIEGAAREAIADAAAIAIPPDAVHASATAARRKLRCAGCGVVESVRRINTRDVAAQVCSRVDGARLRLNAMAGDRTRGAASAFGELLGAAAPESSGADAGGVTWSYRITVRFRDGSRHVFDETTARSLQSGEHVRVIDGAGIAAPAVTALAANTASGFMQP